MLSLDRIYASAPSANDEMTYLIRVLHTVVVEEKALQDDFYSSIRGCITTVSRSGISSGDLLHAIRVLLILMTENLHTSDINVIYAALYHDFPLDYPEIDLFEYQGAASKNSSFKRLVRLFGKIKDNHLKLSNPDVYKADLDLDNNIVQLGSYDKMVMYLLFAERLDQLMMLSRESDKLRKMSLILSTKKYMLPLMNAVGANRFKALFSEVIFRLEDGLSLSEQPYRTITQKLNSQSTFNCLTRAGEMLRAGVENAFSDSLRVLYTPPFAYEIYDRLTNECKKNVDEMISSDILYDIYLVSTDPGGARPSIDAVGMLFLNDRHFSRFALEKVSGGALYIRDDLHNHYKLTVCSLKEYNSLWYGSMTNETPISDRIDIYDADIPESQRIVVRAYEDQRAYILREGATLVDYAFARGLDVFADMSTATVNNEKASYYDTLQNDSVIRLSRSNTPQADASWMVYCTTLRAKIKLSRYINLKLEAAQDILNNSDYARL